MAVRQTKRSKPISREKILLASIPVLGSIIIAFFSIDKSGCNPGQKQIETSGTQIDYALLKAKAGKVNDMVVFKRYNDLFELMSDGLKPLLTKDLFNSVSDSNAKYLGDFVKPIDTTYSTAFGNDNFFIKNQYQKGTNINQIIFDKQGKIFGLYTNKFPQ